MSIHSPIVQAYINWAKSLGELQRIVREGEAYLEKKDV